MSWTSSNPVVAGNATKVSDYNAVWNNAAYNRDSNGNFTQVVIAAGSDGTAAAPAISRSADGTGFYFAAGAVNISGGGTLIATFNTSSGLTFGSAFGTISTAGSLTLQTTAGGASIGILPNGSGYVYIGGGGLSGLTGTAVNVAYGLTVNGKLLANTSLLIGGQSDNGDIFQIGQTGVYRASMFSTGATAAHLRIFNNGGLGGYLMVGVESSPASPYLTGNSAYDCFVGTAGTNGGLTLGTNAIVRAKITSAGSLVMGTAALATNATDGFLYIAGGAGAPTGVPTAFAGRVPMYYDTTNNYLYFYNGGWKKSTVYA